MPWIPFLDRKQQQSDLDKELELRCSAWNEFSETQKEELLNAFLDAATAVILAHPYESYGCCELVEAMALSENPDCPPPAWQYHCCWITFEEKLLLDHERGICLHTRILKLGGYEYRYYYNPKAVVKR